MTTEITLVDLFADLNIDDSDYAFIATALGNQKTYEKLLNDNPNAIVLQQLYQISTMACNERDTRSFKAWINLVKLLLIEFCRDPYWNSKIGYMAWFLVCYARYDSYYPMKWCFHYDPLNHYREGEPIRPSELMKTMPDDPFNIKGECFVHPEWYLYRKADEATRAASSDGTTDGDTDDSECV